MAVFSGAHAAIVIDTFNEGGHSAPPDNEIAVPSAIGGFRLLEQVSGENQIFVFIDSSAGFLFSDHRDIGGQTRAVWNGEDDVGLGGIDLTAGGDRFQLRGVVIDGTPTFAETLTVRVRDTAGGVSAFTNTYQNICRPVGPESCERPIYEIPFSSLSIGADLTLVDSIALEFVTTPVSDGTNIAIGSFQVAPIPIPGAVWLFGSGLLGLIGIARKKIA